MKNEVIALQQVYDEGKIEHERAKAEQALSEKFRDVDSWE